MGMGFGDGGIDGVPLIELLHVDVMGDDGREGVLSIRDCFAFCLLLQLVLAHGFLIDFSITLLAHLSLDGDVTGDEGGMVDAHYSRML